MTDKERLEASRRIVLKPCPCCGANASTRSRYGVSRGPMKTRYYRERTECTNPDCGLSTREHISPGASKRAWNKRALTPELAAGGDVELLKACAYLARDSGTAERFGTIVEKRAFGTEVPPDLFKHEEKGS